MLWNYNELADRVGKIATESQTRWNDGDARFCSPYALNVDALIRAGQKLAWPGVRGNGIASRTLARPVT